MQPEGGDGAFEVTMIWEPFFFLIEMVLPEEVEAPKEKNVEEEEEEAELDI
jgi:hypothetical protein